VASLFALRVLDGLRSTWTYLCETFPLLFHTFWLLGPQMAGDLGDLWVWQPGVLRDKLAVVMLSV
jgi:hypothetical protein